MTGQRSAGRQVLIAVYAVFALAAGARSLAQVATRFDEAPTAYSLSLVAALVYLVATVAFRHPTPTGHRVALVACAVEAAGVLVVGTVSVLHDEWFSDQTVWSGFGSGYGYVPLVLPLVGLVWLLRHPPTGPDPERTPRRP